MSPDSSEARAGATLKEILVGAVTLLRERPELAHRTVKVTGDLGSVTEVRLRAGEHHVVVDEAKAAGGGGLAPNPIQLLLAALASCEAISYRYWSEQLEIPFDSLRVEARASTDLRGILGIAPAADPGLDDVKVTVRLVGREQSERYEALHRAVDAHCPVLDTLRRPLVVSTTLEIDPIIG